MPAPPRPGRFIRRFLTEFLDAQLSHGEISPDEYHNHFDFIQNDPQLEKLATKLFAKSPKPIAVGKLGRLRLV